MITYIRSFYIAVFVLVMSILAPFYYFVETKQADQATKKTISLPEDMLIFADELQ